MWNDTDVPLAYLITFRCYGTWLHGDERGSIDRFHNQYKSSFIAPNENWKRFNAEKQKDDAVTLNAKQRSSIEQTVREVCNHKNWLLRAVNVRTNHVHVVASIGDAKSESALNSFKAYATRNMREQNLWEKKSSPWSDKGSKRKLWNERSIELAVEYVVSGQGGELPEFN